MKKISKYQRSQLPEAHSMLKSKSKLSKVSCRCRDLALILYGPWNLKPDQYKRYRASYVMDKKNTVKVTPKIKRGHKKQLKSERLIKLYQAPSSGSILFSPSFSMASWAAIWLASFLL